MSAWTHPPVRQSVMSVAAETVDHVWQSSVHGLSFVNQTLQLHNHGDKTLQQCPNRLNEYKVTKQRYHSRLWRYCAFERDIEAAFILGGKFPNERTISLCHQTVI